MHAWSADNLLSDKCTGGFKEFEEIITSDYDEPPREVYKVLFWGY